MRKTTAYQVLGFIGLTIMLLAAYSEWVSIDLSRHSFNEYLSNQFALRAWWNAVGVPMVTGATFISFAALGSRLDSATGNRLSVFIGSLLLSLVLVLIIGGIGYYAVVSTGALLASMIASRHNDKD